MLLTRISQPPPSSPTPEDIFSSALTTIFTDDTVNSHGTPGSYVTYRSPHFGDIKLFIPAHPDEEDGRKLFAHYLWNAAVLGADAIESASRDVGDVGDRVAENDREQQGRPSWDRKFWDLRGKTVLELGAGTALPSLIAAFSGAKSCTITDHPSSPALTTGAIEKNVEASLSPIRGSTSEFSTHIHSQHDDNADTQPVRRPRTKATVEVRGYTWGTSTFYLPSAYGKPAPPHTTPQLFDRIIIADCLWMPSQHINLIRTILQFLPPKKSQANELQVTEGSTKAQVSHDLEAKEGEECGFRAPPNDEIDVDVPGALVVAGFHTGRRIVSDFFSLATEAQPPQNENEHTSPSSAHSSDRIPDPSKGNTISLDPSILTPTERAMCGLLRLASVFEVDVDGNTRPWLNERTGEGKWDVKRWCVVGVLIRR